LPEFIKLKFASQRATDPTLPQTPRLFQSERGKFHLHHVGASGRALLGVGEQTALEALPVLVNDFDGPLPPVELRRVEFTQAQELTLHDAPRMQAQALADGIINVIFPVLMAHPFFSGTWRQNRTRPEPPARGQVGTQGNWRDRPLPLKELCKKKSENRRNLRRSGYSGKSSQLASILRESNSK
jgi:hypothetical protein